MPIQRVEDLLQGMRDFPASRWFVLGVNLGVKKTDLDDIHTDKSLQSGVERCKLEMLDKWFKSSKSTPTWAKVYDALCAVNEKRLAVQIATDYGKFVGLSSTGTIRNSYADRKLHKHYVTSRDMQYHVTSRDTHHLVYQK